MGRPKSFGIVTKKTDTFFTMDRAKSASDLAKKYPSSIYSVFDMTGKDEIPKKTGAFSTDLTIHGGEWAWKLSDQEISDRSGGKRKKMILRRIIDLEIRRDKAKTMGPQYKEIEGEYATKVAELEEELASL